MGLGEVDRARTLYSKLVEWDPESCAAWSRFAGLEAGLGEAARARALLELAVAQPALDAPELLWKHFIDFEISKRKRRRARALYERLLERTGHVKVWLSFAAFEEAALPEKSGDDDDDESDEDDDNDSLVAEWSDRCVAGADAACCSWCCCCCGLHGLFPVS